MLLLILWTLKNKKTCRVTRAVFFWTAEMCRFLRLWSYSRVVFVATCTGAQQHCGLAPGRIPFVFVVLHILSLYSLPMRSTQYPSSLYAITRSKAAQLLLNYEVPVRLFDKTQSCVLSLSLVCLGPAAAACEIPFSYDLLNAARSAQPFFPATWYLVILPRKQSSVSPPPAPRNAVSCTTYMYD